MQRSPQRCRRPAANHPEGRPLIEGQRARHPCGLRLLFGVQPLDAATVTAMPAMLAVGLLASQLPARKASGLAPVDSLRASDALAGAAASVTQRTSHRARG